MFDLGRIHLSMTLVAPKYSKSGQERTSIEAKTDTNVVIV